MAAKTNKAPEVSLSDDVLRPAPPNKVLRLVRSDGQPIGADAHTDARGPRHAEAGAAASANVVALGLPPTSVGRREAVRGRLNAAIRPILVRFASDRNLPTAHLREHIEGDRPLTAEPIVRELQGAFHLQPLRAAIAAYADPALVPAEVRGGVAAMLAQDLGSQPPSEIRRAFPDWNKPLMPRWHFSEAWHPEDAARWLRDFPPRGTLRHPIDTWDDQTAAIWLDDRPASIVDPGSDRDRPDVVAFRPGPRWMPASSIPACLDELDLETLLDRVFRERFRREIMLPLLGARRDRIREAVAAMSYGYISVGDALRNIHERDVATSSRFDALFGSDAEWIFDLVHITVDGYAWPPGFTQSGLIERFGPHDAY